MKVVAYARFSSDNQREESIAAQIRAIKKYCNDNKLDLIKVYKDEAISATTDQRPNFLQMIQDSKNQEFEGVIVHKFDRFARNRYDSTKYKHILKLNGVRVYSVLEPISDSPESVLMESLYEGMAEYYSLNLAREVRKGMIENAEKALHTGGIPPLGYDIVNKKYVINEYEAQAVKLIYELYASGKTYSKIIKVLNEKGYKTKRRRDFKKNSIYEILGNEKYIGNYVYKVKQYKVGNKRNTHAKISSDNIIRKNGIIPRIIDNDTWNMVQKKRQDKKRMGRKAMGKAIEPYLFSGKIYCGECEAKMYGNRRNCARKGRTPKYYSNYICSDSCGMPGIEKNSIEKEVLYQIKNYFTPEVKEKIFNIVKNNFIEDQKNKNNELIKYRAELEKTNIQIDNMIKAIADGFYQSSMKEKIQDLENKKIELNSLIEQAQSYILPSFEQFDEFLSTVLDFKNPKCAQTIIDTFVESIIVYRHNIKINIIVDSGIKSMSVDTSGVPRGIRTPDLVVRSHTLYPAEP